MTGAITRCRILTPDVTFDSGTIVFDERGRITAVGREVEPPPGAEITDARSLTIVPGFIDLHVHGGGDYSLATHDPDEIRSYARWVVSRGVTSFVATIFAPGINEGLEFVRSAAEASGQVEGGATVLGVNLEGPFVSPERRGALPAGWMAPPDVGAFKRLVDAADGHLRLMTLAPELPGGDEVLREASGNGIVVAVGHSNADYETASITFLAGASHVTHLFNAMRPFHHRDPGIVGAAYDQADVTVELIADGVHVDPTVVAMTVRVFGPNRVALVTDAATPAGMAHGTFRVGGEEAHLVGDRVLLEDGTIAGGAATMNQIVRNIVDRRIAELSDAVRMASTVPARVLGLSGRKGRIAQGYDADLVALDGDLGVAMTWVGGRPVHPRA